MAQKKIIRQLHQFRERVSKDTPVARMILFGSQAWGKPHRDSDIDLLIVSPNFKGQKSFRRGLSFYKHWNLHHPVDFLCYTPQEFEKLRKQITLVREAAEKGVEVE